MDPTISEWLNLIFRWVHVVAGIMWIGLLYFFNFINGHVAATFDADAKKKVVPELMPRTLYWFRWGAAYTWITGVLLLGIVYYMGGIMVDADSTMSVGAATGIGLGLLVVAWAIYDTLWKAMAKNEMAAVIISYALTVGVAFALTNLFSGRAAYIHVGAMFGTLMAGNVWMRIWPAQRRIIAATKAGTAPDANDGAIAKLRSKHNTYMSVPLVFMMLSNHFPSTFGSTMNWVILAVMIAAGWAATKFLYNKGGSEAPKFF
ncbi:MAG: urate hydroxylase PuuD [Myxococcota bacterium]